MGESCTSNRETDRTHSRSLLRAGHIPYGGKLGEGWDFLSPLGVCQCGARETTSQDLFGGKGIR